MISLRSRNKASITLCMSDASWRWTEIPTLAPRPMLAHGQQIKQRRAAKWPRSEQEKQTILACKRHKRAVGKSLNISSMSPCLVSLLVWFVCRTLVMGAHTSNLSLGGLEAGGENWRPAWNPYWDAGQHGNPSYQASLGRMAGLFTKKKKQKKNNWSHSHCPIWQILFIYCVLCI